MEPVQNERGEGGFVEKSIRDGCRQWSRQATSTGESLDRIGDQLQSLGATQASRLAKTGAHYARHLACYLERADLDTVLHDAERYARRQPAAVIGASFFLGVASARMLKVGSSRRYYKYGDQLT